MTKIIYLIVFLIGFAACQDKEFTKDPVESFGIAKGPYEDEDYEKALTRLGEFKSRFPYSQYAIEAELLIADCHFKLGQYEEAAEAYATFAKLHPKHVKLDFALFRIGESNWKLSPEAIDREQEFTVKAVEEWEKLINRIPNSPYTKEAKELVAKGKLRLAESYEFIMDFNCRQDIPHACAFTATNFLERYPQYKEMRIKALKLAVDSLNEVAKFKEKDPSSDANIYFQTMTAEEIRAMAKKLEEQYRKNSQS